MRSIPKRSGVDTAGTTPTTYNFTGQRKDTGSGLLFYNARWYDPVVGRFLSADTLVPAPGNPQSLNRYSYVLNNPLIYLDPTGHGPECSAIFMGDPLTGAVTMLCQVATAAASYWPEIQALAVQYGPPAGQFLQQWGDKLPGLVDQAGQLAKSAKQAVSQAGNTADPGGLDPKRWGTNYRANYEEYYGVARDLNYQVHHVLLQQWRDVLTRANINVDDPRWLREIQAVPGDENLHARFFTTRWGEFTNNLQGRTPTPQEIIRHAQELEREYFSN